MLFTALILVSVDCEHDGLQQLVNLCQRDQATKMSDVSRLGLEQEQEIAIFLCLLIVGECSFRKFV